MTISKLTGGTIDITKGQVLTEDQLQAIKWYCLTHDGKCNLSFLGKKQIKQLAKYIFSECEKYSSSHSMRYTILRDFVKALLLA